MVGIIGHPVSHSLSPAMHNAAFAALGLDYIYVPLPVRPAEVGAAIEGLAALGFRGANVTVPHKRAVIPHLQCVTGDASLVEAVNTIVAGDEGLVGYNTDVEGVREAVTGVTGTSLDGVPGLLLGAGGAARAAALALARLGVRLTVVNRTAAAAERLSALIVAAVPGAECEWLTWNRLDAELVASRRLIVNATSLGMSGAGKVPSVLADTIGAEHVVLDVVYTRGDTDLLVRARARGATVIGGLEMLVGQAAAAFELWTGRPAPVQVMRDAVER